MKFEMSANSGSLSSKLYDFYRRGEDLLKEMYYMDRYEP